MRNVSIGVAGVVVLLILLSPASAEWNQQTLLESDTYMQVFGVSDDGSRIVYIADTDGNRATLWDWEVFLMDLNTGEVTRITRNVDQEVQAGISGDGNVIVYGTKKIENGETVYRYYRVQSTNGWQNPQPLKDRNGNEFVVSDEFPSWRYNYMEIPSIAISYTGHRTLIPVIYGVDYVIHGVSYLFLYDRVTNIYGGAWYPVYKGNNWVFGVETQRNEQFLDLYPNWQRIISTNTDVEMLFGSDQDFSVSEDGKVVFRIYSEDPTARKGIFLYDNGNIIQISNDDLVADVVISGDGSKIIYSKVIGGGWGYSRVSIYTMNSDGSGKSLICNFSVALNSRIFTNDDGSKVFLSYYNGDYYKLKLYTPPELTTTYDRIRGINPNIQSSWLANSAVFIPPSTTIEFGSAEGTAGSEVQIPVTIRNAENIGAINLVLSYPTDVLEFEELLAGSLTQNSMIEHNVQDGNISVGIVDTEGISGVGSLFYLKFRVIGEVKKVNVPVEGIESGKKGKTQIESLTQALTERAANSTLAILEAIVNDVDGNDVEVVIINGNFNLISEEEANRGDVNGDGVINSLDALLALQMSVGKLEPNMIADMNDDGKVLANDALEIMRIATENMVSKTLQIVQQGIKQPKQFGKG